MKSFSEITKEELCKNENVNRCCNVAEYFGMLLFGASVAENSIKFVTENHDVLENYKSLSKFMGIDLMKFSKIGKSARISAVYDDHEVIVQLLSRLGIRDLENITFMPNSDIISNDCCRRAFVKGAFLSGGTVVDPQKNYNLEIITPHIELAQDMLQLLMEVGFQFKLITRKTKYVLYLKNSESIVDFLTYMGAYKAQMEYINIKIEKEIRNDMVRAINSETANIEKTINASVEQVRAIEKVDELYGLDSIDEDLRTVALLRLKHKNLSLNELGKQMNPPMSKSWVNRRIKKLIDMSQ